MRHTTTLLLFVLIAPVLIAQRLLPVHPSQNDGNGIFAVAEFDGKLFMGGLFSSIHGQPRTSIIGWQGEQYEHAPGAFTSAARIVRDLVVYDGRLIAAGNEPDLGHVAVWDGTAWSAMGQGFPERTWALAIHDGSLLAGGQSMEVKRWNGETWLLFGELFNGHVYSMAVHNGVLYAGGAFSATQGGTPLPGGLARWNGTAWEAVAGGLNGTVWVLRTDPVGLLIGGAFSATEDGSQTFHNWTILGTAGFLQVPSDPMLPAVRGFDRFPDGRLAVGASTSMNGGVSTSLIVDGNQAERLEGFCVRTSATVNGQHVLFGSGGMTLHRPVMLMGRYDDGIPMVTAAMNDVNASIGPSPHAFRRGNSPGFEVPAGSNTHSLFTSSPLIVAYVDGVRHVSAPLMGLQILGEQFPKPWAGPVAMGVNDAFYERYHQVWQLDRAQVQSHIAHWNDPGYTMPLAIATWPAHGDVANGEPERMAPFMDINGNGIYEPIAGEYPVFRGDRCVYTINHTVQDSEEGDPPLLFDQHSFYHVFNAVPGSALDQTVFVQYQFINRSEQVYDQLRFGQFADMDIGCPADDLAGCDSTRSLFFTYKASDMDTICPPTNGYGAQPPAQGIKFLNEPMRTHSVMRSVVNGNPIIDDLMYGLVDGLPFSSYGWPPDFRYPGGEYMDVITIPTHDRRNLGATGPFTLAPGDTLCIDLAFIFARAPSGGAYASVETLKLRADSVQAFYDGLALDCLTQPVMVGIDEPRAVQPLQLFPNPTTDAVTIVADDGLGRITLMDLQGRPLHTVNTPSDRHTLHLAAHPAGLYIVEVRNANGVRVARLVKQ